MRRRTMFIGACLLMLAAWLYSTSADAQVRVAVEDGSPTGTGAAIVAQLNDDTLFDFTATLLDAAAIDTAGELASYDVVILGDSGSNDNDHTQAMADALLASVQAGGIGVVTVGFMDLSTQAAGPDATLDLLMPVDASPYPYDACGPNSSIDIPNPNAHPVTFGLPTAFITASSSVEYNSQPVDATSAIVHGAVSGSCNANTPRQTIVTGRNGPGRLVYLGLPYMASTSYNNADLRTGNGDRLLEQAVAWAWQRGPIRVAVEDGSMNNGTGLWLAVQLNDDTWFDFTATKVNAAAIDTTAELAGYDVVVFGDSGSNNNDHSQAMADALLAANQIGSVGVVSVGSADYSTLNVDPDATLDLVMPIDASPFHHAYCGALATIEIANPNGHPVTAGLPSAYPVTNSTYVEYNPLAPDGAGATVLGTVSAAMCYTPIPGPWQTIVVATTGYGRNVYLGPPYMGALAYNTGDMRVGNHDRLLEQAIAWAMPVAPLPQLCGNGVVTGTETCDDGNTTAGDGCGATCAVENGWMCTGQPSVCTPICGNGLLHGAEPCDDGNTSSGDGCSATCTVEHDYVCTGEPSVCASTCGNGLVASDEPCDDGNLTGGDGCSATCTVEHGYTCTGEPSVCTSTCGDGLVAGNEACDDGGLFGGGCSARCTVEPGWTCMGEPSVCTAVCGDGLIVTTEQCDDGNTNSMDGCDGACMVELGWTCTGEPSICDTTCGDGVQRGTEECDDGNTTSGDGCDGACMSEGQGGAGGSGTDGSGGAGGSAGGGAGGHGDVLITTGCGCRSGASPSDRAGLAVLALLGLALVRRRRRVA